MATPLRPLGGPVSGGEGGARAVGGGAGAAGGLPEGVGRLPVLGPAEPMESAGRLRVVGTGEPAGGPPEGVGGRRGPAVEPSGWLHSFEAGSAVDGPGMRLVLFLSGCPLRCSFCHNPDTWDPRAGKRMPLGEIVELVGRYADFLRGCGGGVTLSGGDPLARWKFAVELVRGIKQANQLHVTVQTAGFPGSRVRDGELDMVDLWMVDVKAASPTLYKQIAGVEQAEVKAFLKRLGQRSRPVWASYVLVPGLTDSDEALDDLGKWLAEYRNIERLELRPFHQLGRRKWQEMKLTYPLANVPVPSPEQVESAARILRGHGLTVIIG